MRHALIATLATVFVSAPALAQDDPVPPEVKGIKIVIPAAAGKKSHGSKRVTKALRKSIKAGTGSLVSMKAMSKARKKLKLRGKAARSIEGLAKAGRAAGAQYVLLVDVSVKKWLYTAHAQLINTATGEIQMDFRSGFYKPKKEAADRGRRIAKTTLNKIAKLPPIRSYKMLRAAQSKENLDDTKDTIKKIRQPARIKSEIPCRIHKII